MTTPLPASAGPPRGPPRVARIVLLYALLAGLWISLSEVALRALVADPALRALARVFEGGALIGLTSALLFGLLRRHLRLERAASTREGEALQSENRAVQLLRTLSDNSPDIIFAKDREGRYLLRNAAGLREIGRSTEQVIGRDDSAIYPVDQARLLRAHDERVMAQDRAETFEEELDTVNGRRVFLSTKGPLHDTAGSVIGMFGISHDITAQRELERQREAAHARALAAHDLLRDVLARVDDGLVALDREWRYTYLNVQAARMLGRDRPEELIGRHIWTEFPEGVGQPFHRAYERALATQRPVTFEDHYVPWDRWFENRVYPSPEGLSIYFTDITARKQAEDALRAAEAYQRRVFEQLTDGVVLIDSAYRFLDANPRAVEIFGYPRDELLCLGVRDLLPASELSRIDVPLEVVVARRPDLAEWDILRADGSLFTAEVSARPLGEGRFVLVVRDITQRRAAEKTLLTTQIELSELTQRLLTQEQRTTRRIAQALHDHLGQTLAAARLTLEACITTYAQAMPPALKVEAGRIATLLEQSVHEVRQVLTDLRPPLLEEQGLAAALDNEIGSRMLVEGQTDALLEVSEGGFGRRWSAEVEYAAFMVAREAVANARQHAGASLIRVLLDGTEASLSLNVIDDGCGLPAALAYGRPGHLGMVGMRERAIAIGARFKVAPGPAGGTWIGLDWQAPQP